MAAQRDDVPRHLDYDTEEVGSDPDDIETKRAPNPQADDDDPEKVTVKILHGEPGALPKRRMTLSIV